MIRIKQFIESAIRLVGFESIYDYLASTLILKQRVIFLHVYGIFFSAGISFMELLIYTTEEFIYAPARAVFILYIVAIGDFIIGISASLTVHKRKLEANKISRSIMRVCTQLFFVGIFYNLHGIFPFIFPKYAIDGLLIVFILSTIWSSLGNAKDLNWVTEDQYEWIESFVNVKKIIEKVKTMKK